MVDTEKGKMLALRADKFVAEMRSPKAAISDISDTSINDTSEEIKETGSVKSPETGNEIHGEEILKTENRVTQESAQWGIPLEFRGKLPRIRKLILITSLGKSLC